MRFGRRPAASHMRDDEGRPVEHRAALVSGQRHRASGVTAGTCTRPDAAIREITAPRKPRTLDVRRPMVHADITRLRTCHSPRGHARRRRSGREASQRHAPAPRRRHVNFVQVIGRAITRRRRSRSGALPRCRRTCLHLESPPEAGPSRSLSQSPDSTPEGRRGSAQPGRSSADVRCDGMFTYLPVPGPGLRDLYQTVHVAVSSRRSTPWVQVNRRACVKIELDPTVPFNRAHDIGASSTNVP